MITKMSDEQLAEQEQHLAAALEHLDAECLSGWRDLDDKDFDHTAVLTFGAASDAWELLYEVQLERKRRMARTMEA